MYAIQRTRIIKQYLKEHGQASVHTLSGILGVSEVTVRRDLERLEAEGWLTRTHGGAMINGSDPALPGPGSPFPTAGTDHYDEIAGLALRMVEDGDVVMLTNGPVNIHIAGKLEARNGLTILTNDVGIAARVAEQTSNRFVLLGGDLDVQEKAVFGTMAVENLHRFFVQRLFVQIDGINDRLDISVNSQTKADLIRAAMELSDETIITCLPEHFSRNSFFRLGPITMADKVITDTHIEEEYKTRIFNTGVPIYTPVHPFEGTA
jgi:DeoR family transcriptional regulator, fructose operon transcriptional repressor